MRLIDTNLRVHLDYGDEEKHEELERGRDAVRQEVFHALEDDPRNEDRVHDRAEARLREDNVGGGAGRVGGALHRDAHVSAALD
jgi:argininosuccinate lyase